MLRAGQFVGPYRIVRQLGQGGQATAHLAEDSRLSRPVVLKVLRSDAADEAARRRFEREACLCSALDHPNIAAVYDLGEIDGVPYIVMQYVEGKSLKDLLGGRPLSLASALSLGIQIADGLAVAHAAGIVHRDLKPTNVIVTPAGQAKILDFGLAKHLGPARDARLDETLTSVGAPYGTIGYGSPEQATGEPVDHRTDVFSLGVLLYEMLTGKNPFAGRNALEVLHAVVNHVPPALSDRSRSHPLELDAIVERALAKRPRDRYQTMAALRDDLKSIVRRLTHDRAAADGSPAWLRPAERAGRLWPTPFSRLLTWRRPRVLPAAGFSAEADPRPAPVDEEALPAPAPQVRKALAVTPLRNLTGDAALDVLGIALADGLVTTLSALDALRVRPSAAVLRYTGEVDPQRVATEQDAAWVLTGTILRNADRLRVTVQLLAPAAGDLVWADRIDLPAEDALAAQDALSERVLAGLRLHLAPTPDERTEPAATRNAEAYELFLRGREMLGHFVLRSFDVNDLELAIRLHNEAIGLDPDFAGAHASLARCYLLHARGYGEPEYFRLAERSVRRALELKPGSMKARIQEIYVQLLDGDVERARAGLTDVQREAPEHPAVLELAAHLYRLDGDHEGALGEYQRLLALSPADASLVEYKRARVLLQASRLGEARGALERAQRAAPNHALVQALSGLLELCEGRPLEAVRLLDDVLQRHPSFDGVRPLLICGLAARGEDGRPLLTDGVRDSARSDPDVAFWLGAAYANMGEAGEAIAWLLQSVQLGQHDRELFAASPLLRPLQGRGLDEVLAAIPRAPLDRRAEA